jgi:geranylgeranyl diphosphate synthase type II
VNLLAVAQERVNPALEKVLGRIAEPRGSDGRMGAHKVPERLLEAMRYALLAPGKRLRPALVIGGAKAVGADVDEALSGACAVEMVHAYSLVHDDLPALDDDDMRRGQPTLHRAFDEATALLAGDALLTEAIALLSSRRPLAPGKGQRPRRRLRAVMELSRASGAGGMIGGQVEDVELDGPKEVRLGVETLISIHRRKTGRLIQASTAIGGILGGGSTRDIRALRRFGGDMGLAFQLVDDVLDRDGVAALLGAERALEEATRLTERARLRLRSLGSAAEPLVELAWAMVKRTQ